MLPATKSQPKEMLPVGKKPVVQYIVEELERNQFDRVLFITGAGKTAIENHFDHDPNLIRLLREGGKEDLLAELEFERSGARFFYTRQKPRPDLETRSCTPKNFRAAKRLPSLLAIRFWGVTRNRKLCLV